MRFHTAASKTVRNVHLAGAINEIKPDIYVLQRGLAPADFVKDSSLTLTDDFL